MPDSHPAPLFAILVTAKQLGANVMAEPPVSDAPIFKAIVTDGTSIFPVDAIEHEGHVWIVTRWLASPSKEWRTPERIIRVLNIPLRDMRDIPLRQADFSLGFPLPKVLFEERPQLPAEQYVVIEHPPLRFRMPAAQ